VTERWWYVPTSPRARALYDAITTADGSGDVQCTARTRTGRTCRNLIFYGQVWSYSETGEPVADREFWEVIESGRCHVHA